MFVHGDHLLVLASDFFARRAFLHTRTVYRASRRVRSAVDLRNHLDIEMESTTPYQTQGRAMTQTQNAVQDTSADTTLQMPSSHSSERPNERSTGSYYHVTLSGNRRDPLFSSVEDRRALNRIAFDAMRRYGATLHAYCLMSNHFRVLMQVEDRFLIRSLRRITRLYSHHKQRHLKTPLHLFERPYKAERVETGSDFLQLLRHIHLSPVIANKVVTPGDYLWSSHRAYLGYPSVARVQTEFGLSLFAADPARARVAYHQYIAEGIAEDVGYIVEKEEELPAPGVQSEPPTQPSTVVEQDEKSDIADPTVKLPILASLDRNRKRKASRKYLAIY